MPGTKCGLECTKPDAWDEMWLLRGRNAKKAGALSCPAFVQLALAAISRLASHFTRESATDSSNSTSEASSCLYVKRLTTTATMRLTAKPGMIS